MVADIMITKTRDEWMKIFSKADFPHEILQDIEDIMQDEQVLCNKFLFKKDFEDGTSYMFTNVPIFFGGQPVTDFVHSRPIGADMVEVLKGAGYTDEQIEKLRQAGTIVG